MDNSKLLLTLEKASRDRDFFILNKNRILEAYLFLDELLGSYIDVCCHVFKSFRVNKTSYVYGSIATMALGIVLCKDRFFKGSLGSDPIENLARDIFPLFIDAYNTTTLVESKTQCHMLNGYVDEFKKINNKQTNYVPGIVDTYLKDNEIDVVKYYLNQIIHYCVDYKLDGYDSNDVVNELLPHLQNIKL